MKYYVFETAIVDGQQANGVTVKDNRKDALMLFHQIRASCLANDNMTYSLTIIFDEWGNEVQKESYVPPAPEEQDE